MTLLSSLLSSNTRVPVADANTTLTPATDILAFTSITASRTVTLPLAANVPAGNTITIVDESGSVTAANSIVITTSGSDTLNGGSTISITSAYGTLIFESNGSNKWTTLTSASGGVGLTRGRALALAIRN